MYYSAFLLHIFRIVKKRKQRKEYRVMAKQRVNVRWRNRLSGETGYVKSVRAKLGHLIFLDSILKRRKSMLSKVREVFTKEYREETEYREFADTMLHHFKLKNTSESIEDKIRRLSDEKFVSNFNIKVGRY